MKLKFSKKLKWLGIGTGLLALTAGVAAPVLVSCSDNSSTDNGGSNGGNNNGGSTGGNNGSQNPGGGVITDAPVSTIDPENSQQVLAPGAINGSFNLLSSADTAAISADATTWTPNTAPDQSNSPTLSGVTSFRTYANAAKNGFAFNMVINQPLKYVAFGQYTNDTSGALPADGLNFLFGGENNAGNGLISNDWMSKNGFSVPESGSATSWRVDSATIADQMEKNPETTFKLKFGEVTGTSITNGFWNDKAFEWNITDPTQDQTLIKTSYVLLTLTLSSGNKTTRVQIPINFNVIYEYKAQAKSNLFNVDANAKLALAANDGFYIAQDKTTEWQGANAANWQIDSFGSDETNNILNVRVDQADYLKLGIKTPTAEKLIGTKTSATSIINPQWLNDNGFTDKVLEADTTNLTVGFSTVSDNNSITIANQGTTGYIYTTEDINWNSGVAQTKQARGFTTPKYSQYVSYPLIMTISKKDSSGKILLTKDVNLELRFVEPSTPFNANENVLVKDASALLTGTNSSSLSNANIASGNMLSFKVDTATATAPKFRMTAVIPYSTSLKSFAIKQFTLSDLINNGIINQTWLDQNGFSANAKLTWNGFGNTQPKATIGTEEFTLSTQTIKGSQYFVLDQNLQNYDFLVPASMSNVQTLTFGFSLTITENDKELNIPLFTDFVVPPFVAFKPSLTDAQSTALKDTYKSTTGYVSDAPTYELGGTDVAISSPANNDNNAAYLDDQYGSLLTLNVTKSAAKYFAFRLPTAQDLLDTTNGLLNAELVSSYQLVADELDPANPAIVTKAGNIKSVSYTIDPKLSQTSDLSLNQVSPSLLNIDDPNENNIYIANQNALDDANNPVANGDYDIVYTLRIEKTDGTVITLPITIRITIK